MVLKIGLDKLKQYLNEAVEEAENIYYNENKEQTKEQFENFINEIENNLEYVRKGNFLDLNTLRIKNFNNDDKNSFISLKDIIITNVDDNNEKNYNMNNNKNYNSDSISYSEHDDENDEDKKNQEIKIKGNIKKKKTYIKKTSKKENIVNLVKNTSLIKIGRES